MPGGHSHLQTDGLWSEYCQQPECDIPVSTTDCQSISTVRRHFTHSADKSWQKHRKQVQDLPQESYCGHRFCKLCIEPLLASEEPQKCPCCVEEKAETEYSNLKRSETFPDNATKREFHQLPARCPNEGCNWTGTFKEYERHENRCEFKLIHCVCGQSISASRYKHHIDNECPKREVQCPHCRAKYPFEEDEAHKETCPNIPLKCKLCGREGILREQLEAHVNLDTGDCTAPRVKCPFGCSYVSPNALAQHLDENLVRHVTILRERIDELGDADHPTSRQGSHRRANMTSATQSSGGAAAGNIQPQAQPSGDLSGIPEKLQIVEVKVTTFESIVGVLNTEIEKCVLKLDASDRQSRTDKEQMTQTNRKLKDLERQLALKDVTIAELDLRIQSLECTNYTGVLIWKITDFAKKRQDARLGRMTSVYSPHPSIRRRQVTRCVHAST
ncbi:TNF receptor-associated factor 2 [Lamellibrachia satsuma]|nr:TNF receptor-associated factor 2 [Lamellibrachia satsuma]